MSIQTILFSILKGIVNNQVYPMVAPQNIKPPYIVYQRIGIFDTQTTEGTQSLDLARFQITLYSASYSQSVILCEDIKAEMNEKYLLLMHTEDYENDTKFFCQILDYQLSF